MTGSVKRYGVRRCSLLKGLIACGAAWGLFITSGAARAEQPSSAQQRSAADDLVAEALQRQIYGQVDAHDALLAEARQLAPDSKAARWQSGQVYYFRKWLSLDAATQAADNDGRLTSYAGRRDQTPDTVEGQLKLAAWCGSEGLQDQQRAHLTRVLALDPDQPQARAQLGYQRVGNEWVSKDDLKAAQSRVKSRSAALAVWRPRIERLAHGFQSTSLKQKQWATQQILKIADPAAIAALEEVLAPLNQEAAVLTIQVLSNINDPEASLALARIGVFYQWAPAREAAAAALKPRPRDEYVPALLSAMVAPIRTRSEVYTEPSGRLLMRQVMQRDGQEHNDQMVLLTEYRRVAMPGGDSRQTLSRAVSDLQQRQDSGVETAQRQNAQTDQLNKRIMDLLASATVANVIATPTEWWAWWNQENEVYVPDEKPVQTTVQQQQVAVSDQTYISLGSSGSGGSLPILRQMSVDCLAADTPVWTERGPKAIQTLRVGDRVLSQDPETGQLAFKPVLRTTVRPAGPLMRIDIGSEYIRTSGGHLFWVAGDGWTRSRQLKSGALLQSPCGPTEVSYTEQDGFGPTYNLVVADFNTYFVGQGKVLSHDNTVRRPTRAVVPGLLAD